jgi:hypothetical protein
MKIYERIYDNPKNKDGTDKPNVFLGEFEIIGGDEMMNDYSYECYGKKDGKLFKITGMEISYENGGTKNWVTPIEECPDVKAYLTNLLPPKR